MHQSRLQALPAQALPAGSSSYLPTQTAAAPAGSDKADSTDSKLSCVRHLSGGQLQVPGPELVSSIKLLGRYLQDQAVACRQTSAGSCLQCPSSWR